MSQAALAVKMGVDQAHVSALERGQQNVTIISPITTPEALQQAEPFAISCQAPVTR